MNKKEELKFLKKCYDFRMKLLREYCFVDNRLILDIKQFGINCEKIMTRIVELEKITK